MKHIPALSIVVPVYNEAASLASVIQSIFFYAKTLSLTFEIILVNDGSKDASAQIAQTLIGKISILKVVNHAYNQGFGAAIRTGIAHAQYEYVLCIPIDNPLEEESFLHFSQAAAKADVVLGYRLERRGYTTLMRCNSWIYHLFISWFFNLHYKDYNWIHLYKKSIFNEIQCKAKGIFILAEIIIEAHKKGFEIVEIPIAQQVRLHGTASAAQWKTMKKVALECWHYMQKNRR